MPTVIKGYDPDNWYPKIEPVIPRVYHEYAPASVFEQAYNVSEIGLDKAYYTVKDGASAPTHLYNGAKIEVNRAAVTKFRLLPGSNKEHQASDKISIKNVGTLPVYIRAHVAIPAALDDANPTFNASYNMLHFNADKETSLALQNWSWAKRANDGRKAGDFIGSSGWNWYLLKERIDYNVYAATFEVALAPGETTSDVIYQCYLDAKATPEDIKKVYDQIKTNEWGILVAVEAITADVNTDAFTALDEACPVGSRNLFLASSVSGDLPEDSGEVVPPAPVDGEDDL